MKWLMLEKGQFWKWIFTVISHLRSCIAFIWNIPLPLQVIFNLVILPTQISNYTLSNDRCSLNLMLIEFNFKKWKNDRKPSRWKWLNQHYIIRPNLPISQFLRIVHPELTINHVHSPPRPWPVRVTLMCEFRSTQYSSIQKTKYYRAKKIWDL